MRYICMFDFFQDESSISLFPKRFLRFAETAAPLPEGPRPLEELDSDDDFEEIQQRSGNFPWPLFYIFPL